MHSVVFASLLLAIAPPTPTPGTVAHWVLTDDDPSPALQSADALTRATASRVAAVRDVKASLPALRTAFGGENDSVAQREELRALLLLGDESDVDRAIFDNVRILGYQDTLLVDGMARQYFRNSFITGDTDFIFGNATAVFDRCTIESTDQ